jgi:peptidoglycan/LPS O-acetylase OafA/YrhL
VSKNNSLNFIRLFAALLVFIAHGNIFYGNAVPSFLTVSYGALGVAIFFIISGYLVSKSWDSTPNAIIYLKKRSLRIFPALFVCIVLTVFVLGPLVTTLTVWEYFTHHRTYEYFSNIALYIVYYLPGVFENLRVPNAVNGSLWSLPVEFSMYLMVLFLGLVLRAHKHSYLLALIILVVFEFLIKSTKSPIIVYATDLRTVIHYGIFYFAGAIINKYELESFLIPRNTIICSLILLTTYYFGLPVLPFMWICLPVIVLAVGLKTGGIIAKYTKNIDYSYGLYIYAFPIQQTVIYFFPKINFSYYFIFTLAITLIFAILSWHIIEKPALQFKPK